MCWSTPIYSAQAKDSVKRKRADKIPTLTASPCTAGPAARCEARQQGPVRQGPLRQGQPAWRPGSQPWAEAEAVDLVRASSARRPFVHGPPSCQTFLRLSARIANTEARSSTSPLHIARTCRGAKALSSVTAPLINFVCGRKSTSGHGNIVNRPPMYYILSSTAALIRKKARPVRPVGRCGRAAPEIISILRCGARKECYP